MSKTIYMEVTRDRFELPVAVADTVVELARITGNKAINIYSCMSHAKKFDYKTPYIKVEIDEEE